MSVLSVVVRRGLGLAVALAVLAALVGAPVVAAKSATCQVVNTTGHARFGTLQAAVDAASPGDVLRVRGTCDGSTTIGRSLTIVGQGNPGHGPATLDAGGSGRVLTIGGGVIVTLRGLLITNGSADHGGGIASLFSLGGRNTVTLRDSVVAGNSATFGGGIANDSGTFTIVDSIVSGNTASADGGGVHNSLDGGDLVVRGASAIRANHAGGDGGGIYTTANGSATVAGTTSIDHNTAGGDGGGIRIADSAVTLDDASSVHHNTAAGNGGGAFTDGAPGSIILNGSSSIAANVATNGAGVYAVMSIVRLTGTSSITDNAASGQGGGVFNLFGSSIEIGAGGAISGNTPDNCYPTGIVPGCTG